jgi:hypothetical protein
MVDAMAAAGMAWFGPSRKAGAGLTTSTTKHQLKRQEQMKRRIKVTLPKLTESGEGSIHAIYLFVGAFPAPWTHPTHLCGVQVLNVGAGCAWLPHGDHLAYRHPTLRAYASLVAR